MLVPTDILRKFAATVKARQTTRSTPGERQLANMIGPVSGFAPGAWADNPYEQILHWRTIVYQCGDFISQNFAREQPTAVRVDKNGTKRAKYQLALKGWRMGRNAMPEPPGLLDRKIIEKSTGPTKPQDEYEELDESHELSKLLRDPNEPDTGYPFWYLACVYYVITGRCYLFKGRNGAGQVESLWNLPSQWVRPVCLGNDKLIDYYEVQPPRMPLRRYDPEDIIQIRKPSPFHPLAATSATAMNAAEIDTHDQITGVQNVTLHNRVSFSGQLKAKDNTVSSLSDAAMARIESMFLARYGGVNNSGRPLLLEPGWEWAGMPECPDLAMTESKEAVRKLIIQGYGLDTSYFDSNEATYASALESRQKLRLMVIEPIMRTFAEALTERLARGEFGEDLRVIYLDKSIQSHEERRKDIELLANKNAITMNEMRCEFGFEPRAEPECDELLAQPGMIPLSEMSDYMAQEHQNNAVPVD